MPPERIIQQQAVNECVQRGFSFDEEENLVYMKVESHKMYHFLQSVFLNEPFLLLFESNSSKEMTTSTTFLTKPTGLVLPFLLPYKKTALCTELKSEDMAQVVTEAGTLEETQARLLLADFACQFKKWDIQIPLVVIQYTNGFIGQRFELENSVYETLHVQQKRSSVSTLSEIADLKQLLYDLIRQDTRVKVIADYSIDGDRNVHVLSAWSGTKALSHILCPPPPECVSLLCFKQLDQIQVNDADAFTKRLVAGIAVLQGLDAKEATPGIISREWTTKGDKAWSSMVVQLLQEPDEYGRRDMDFLEKLWELITSVETLSLDRIIYTLTELSLLFTHNQSIITTLPVVHKSNTTTIATYLREGIHLLNNTSNGRKWDQYASEMKDMNIAIESLVELGMWCIQREVKHWLQEQGLAPTVLDQFIPHELDKLENLVKLITLSKTYGTTPSSISLVLGQAVKYYETHPADSCITFSIPMTTSLPDRLRMLLGDPLFWQMKIETSDSERVYRFVKHQDDEAYDEWKATKSTRSFP